MTANNKIKILFELGEASHGGVWADYLQYGFDETDASALLEVEKCDIMSEEETVTQ